MKRSRWFALIPAIAGISLLVLGYYLDAEVIKIYRIPENTLLSSAEIFNLLFNKSTKKPKKMPYARYQPIAYR